MAIDDNQNYFFTGEQVKDLASRLSASVADIKNKVDKALTGSSDPTTSTEGQIGQLYINETSGGIFILKEIVEESGEPDTYTWEALGLSIDVVQAPGTSTTDVMSQNAVTGMVYADPNVLTHIRIGNGATSPSVAGVSRTVTIGREAASTNSYAVAIGSQSTAEAESTAVGGEQARATGVYSTAFGTRASASGVNSVAVGCFAQATQKGQFDISTLGDGLTTTKGYNGSAYRLLTGVYDPQNDHDAATKGYVDGSSESLTIATSDWSTLSSSDPYTYQATVTATTIIGANSTVELINDAPVDFATYGFVIGAVDTTNNTVTVYAIGQPDASKTLTINVKG